MDLNLQVTATSGVYVRKMKTAYSDVFEQRKSNHAVAPWCFWTSTSGKIASRNFATSFRFTQKYLSYCKRLSLRRHRKREPLGWVSTGWTWRIRCVRKVEGGDNVFGWEAQRHLVGPRKRDRFFSDESSWNLTNFGEKTNVCLLIPSWCMLYVFLLCADDRDNRELLEQQQENTSKTRLTYGCR